MKTDVRVFQCAGILTFEFRILMCRISPRIPFARLALSFIAVKMVTRIVRPTNIYIHIRICTFEPGISFVVGNPKWFFNFCFRKCVRILGTCKRPKTLPRDVSATLYPSERCFSDVRGPFRTQNSDV